MVDASHRSHLRETSCFAVLIQVNAFALSVSPFALKAPSKRTEFSHQIPKSPEQPSLPHCGFGLGMTPRPTLTLRTARTFQLQPSPPPQKPRKVLAVRRSGIGKRVLLGFGSERPAGPQHHLYLGEGSWLSCNPSEKTQ